MWRTCDAIFANFGEEAEKEHADGEAGPSEEDGVGGLRGEEGLELDFELVVVEFFHVVADAAVEDAWLQRVSMGLSSGEIGEYNSTYRP